MPAKRVLKLRDINNVHTYIYTCSNYVCLYKITINRYIYTCTVYNNGIVEYQTKKHWYSNKFITVNQYSITTNM